MERFFLRHSVEYAHTVWSPFRAKLIEEVEKVQKRATKILHGLRQLSYTQRLQKLQLPTLVYRRARGDMIKMFKIVHGYYDPEGVPYLQPSSYCNYTRGHNLIWICAKTLLQSELFLNGIRCLLTWWTHRVLMPSRFVSISFGWIKKLLQLQIPTIERSSVVTFTSGYTGSMAFVQYLFAFAGLNMRIMQQSAIHRKLESVTS